MMTARYLAILLALAVVRADVSLLPKASFETGKDAPEGWALAGGKGAWEQSGLTGKRSVSVSGNGKDMVYWRSQAPPMKPGATYRVAFSLKTLGGESGGCAFARPSFAFRTCRPTTEWTRHSFVFTPTNKPGDAVVRFIA